MEKEQNWGKIIGIGCGGCALLSCMGMIGVGGIAYLELEESAESFDLVSIEILGLSDGGSSEWDEEVKSILISNFDSDGSGEIDSDAEVRLIDCDVWQALQLSMVGGGEYSSNILAVYGFDPSLIWVGYALGFSETVRTTAYSAGAACIDDTPIGEMPDLSGFDDIGEIGPSLLFQRANYNFGPVAQSILNLPNGGSSAWDEMVKNILLARYDRSGNGSLEVSGEISAISCDVWAALDIGMRSGGEYDSSLYTVYGFDPALMWVGSAIGIDEVMRSQSYGKAVECYEEAGH